MNLPETQRKASLPNFIIAGAAKCGTTSMDDILKDHPDIYLPLEKELHFFDNDDFYAQGKQFYQKFYAKHSGEKAIGDITPAYMIFPEVPARMKETLGEDLKIIFSLRNPMERAFSDYINLFKLGFIVETDFMEAVEKETSHKDQLSYIDRIYYSLIERSMYAKYLVHYFEAFPCNNFHFILFEEDFLNNKSATFEQLQQFIGVKPENLDVNLKSNKAELPRFRHLNRLLFHPGPVQSVLKIPAKLIPTRKIKKAIKDGIKKVNVKEGAVPKLSPELKAELYHRFFSEDIDQLESMIGRDLSGWKVN